MQVCNHVTTNAVCVHVCIFLWCFLYCFVHYYLLIILYHVNRCFIARGDGVLKKHC